MVLSDGTKEKYLTLQRLRGSSLTKRVHMSINHPSPDSTHEARQTDVHSEHRPSGRVSETRRRKVRKESNFSVSLFVKPWAFLSRLSVTESKWIV